jgi:hypothetical protein
MAIKASIYSGLRVLARERFECALSRGASAITVDRRVPKVAIEPRHERFVGRRLFRAGNDLHKGVLQNVFGERAIPDFPLEEPQKCAVILEQNIERFLHHVPVYVADLGRCNGAARAA